MEDEARGAFKKGEGRAGRARERGLRREGGAEGCERCGGAEGGGAGARGVVGKGAVTPGRRRRDVEVVEKADAEDDDVDEAGEGICDAADEGVLGAERS